MSVLKVKIGSYIKFRAATRWADRAVWRKVNGIESSGNPTVRYGGWPQFVVRLKEISEIRDNKPS